MVDFARTIPVEEVKMGRVFYADGSGYAVVVLVAGDKLAKAYTSYGRPLVLLNSGEGEFKVYTEDNEGTKEEINAGGERVGSIQEDENGDEIVVNDEGECLGYIAYDGGNIIVVKDGEVVYKNVERNGVVKLGEAFEKIEYKEVGKALSIELAEDWREQLGEDAGLKIRDILVDVLSNSLHERKLSKQGRKWSAEVLAFREKQKPVKVNGKMFKPKASRFVCGYERDGVLHLYFIKKITDVIYRVKLDRANIEAGYVIEECDDEVLRGEIQAAVREKLIPLAAYDEMFGKRTVRMTQVSGQISVDLHERMKWGDYSLPQVIKAGVQALEDRERYGERCSEMEAEDVERIVKNGSKGSMERRLLRAVLLGEEE